MNFIFSFDKKYYVGRKYQWKRYNINCSLPVGRSPFYFLFFFYELLLLLVSTTWNVRKMYVYGLLYPKKKKKKSFQYAHTLGVNYDIVGSMMQVV